MVATRRRNRGVAAGGDDTTASPESGSPQKTLDPVLRSQEETKAPKRMYEAHQGGPVGISSTHHRVALEAVGWEAEQAQVPALQLRSEMVLTAMCCGHSISSITKKVHFPSGGIPCKCGGYDGLPSYHIKTDKQKKSNDPKRKTIKKAIYKWFQALIHNKDPYKLFALCQVIGYVLNTDGLPLGDHIICKDHQELDEMVEAHHLKEGQY